MQKRALKVAVLGFGREGQSVLRFLLKQREYRGAEIWILDKNTNAKSRIDAQVLKQVHLQLGPGYLKQLSRFDVIFRSPGIPYTLPALSRARCDETIVTSATKLFFEAMSELAARRRPTIIGVTGTKGKGTTSTLIYEMLRRAGRNALLAGNIGAPMLDALESARRAEFVVLELSSFQLQDLPASPQVAVVLDVFPDHLDQHRSLREYYGSKANIGRFQKKSDAIFYFAENLFSRSIAAKSPARKFPVRPRESNLRKNHEMASAAARFLGVPERTIETVLKSFRGLEHRLELVRTIHPYSHILKNMRISFWNDSAATNPTATAAAIHTFTDPLILIAGGKDKNLSFRPLSNAIRNAPHVKAVILFGENKNKIRKALGRNVHVEIKIAKTLSEAVRAASLAARKLINSSTDQLITILFSPASASFDMFESYADRGKQFKRIVRGL